MPLVTGFALAVSLALIPGTITAGTMQVAQSGQGGPMPVAQSVEGYVRTYFADTPIMIDIARCESHFSQFDTNGQVHRGVVNDKDVGVMQVNEYYHGATAQKLGLDLYTIQGNVAYARYLYNKEGTQPWDSSQKCWAKSDKVAVK